MSDSGSKEGAEVTKVPSRKEINTSTESLKTVLTELLNNLNELDDLKQKKDLDTQQNDRLASLEDETKLHQKQLQQYLGVRRASQIDATLPAPIPLLKVKVSPGSLMLCETILGIIILGLTACYTPRQEGGLFAGFSGNSEQIYLLLVSFGFLLTTFLLLVVNMVEIKIYNKTVFESLYHSLAFVFYFTASIAFIVVIENDHRNDFYIYGHGGKLAAAVLALLNSLCYLSSAILSVYIYMTV